jgi:rod shape-determining protein MreB
MSLFDFFGMMANDIAIDLGTANTLVYKKNGGVVIDEPSVVAVSADGKKIIAIGAQAKEMLGKNPDEVRVIKPLKDGVIADFQVTELMLRNLILRAQKKRLLVRPRIIVCVPSGITEVEKRAVRDSALHAGAREVFLISEPVAAAIGAGLPIEQPCGNMVMDIGGGTSEIAVISLSHIVVHNSIRVGGDKLDTDIISYLRKKNNLHVGIQTAEKIKKTIGSAYPLKQELTMDVRGRDIVSGYLSPSRYPRGDSRSHLRDSLTMIDASSVLFERTLPSFRHIAERGIFLTVAEPCSRVWMKRSQDGRFARNVVPDPLECVVKGAGTVLDDVDNYREVLIKRIED